ncbi:MAG: hypothetical protein WCE54_07515 [Ignavibacteriaceae bacterium]
MKLIYLLSLGFLLSIVVSNLSPAQQKSSKDVPEISFNDNTIDNGFNRIFLLMPGEQIIINNLCSSEEIAIGFKSYVDISNKLALFYQNSDSISLKIISEYKNIDHTINNIGIGLKMISDDLHKVNLQRSIELLNKSGVTLENSNKKLEDAVEKLNEINSDLTGFYFGNLWSILIAGIAGFAAGALIF